VKIVYSNLLRNKKLYYYCIIYDALGSNISNQLRGIKRGEPESARIHNQLGDPDECSVPS
jgi:hypothetical protein